MYMQMETIILLVQVDQQRLVAVEHGPVCVGAVGEGGAVDGVVGGDGDGVALLAR